MLLEITVIIRKESGKLMTKKTHQTPKSQDSK